MRYYTTLWRLLFSSWIIFALNALAQAPEGTILLEEIPPPPKVIEGEPLDKSSIDTHYEGKNKIDEYSFHGQVYMMKITPPNGKAYYMHRDTHNGAWINDGPNPILSIPQWVLVNF